MRLSWNRGHCLEVLAAAVSVPLMAAVTYAQYMPYGNQVQPQRYGVQQQSYAAQPTWQGSAAQQQAQNYGMQQPNPQYTATAYNADEGAAPQPTPMPAQDYSYQSQSVPTTYDGDCYNGCGSGCEYNYYNTFDAGCGYGGGCFNCGHNRCGGTYCMPGCGCGPRWFGGVYGLLMERGRSNCVPLGFVTADGAGAGYYPTDPEILLYNHTEEIGYQGGLELRFGMYVGGRGGCGPVGRPYNAYGGGAYSCDSSCFGGGPTHAWEAVYWTLFEADASASLFDATGDGNRLYGMINFTGLEIDPGDGFRDANVFFDYGPPTTDNSAPYDVEVRQLTVRNTFSAQNIELNLLRLPMAFGGNSCGCGPRCALTALAGFRFMRFDDDFWFRSDWERMDTNALGFNAYDIQVDNTLYGAQIGGSGTYRFGSSGRLAFHCGTTVGFYGNHMEMSQFMNDARFANGTLEDFDIDSTEDNVSVVGEIRLGLSYQCHRNWRIYSGWRLLGVTGVAVAVDQIPGGVYTTPQEVGFINGEGSFLLHGLQSGLEYTY